MYHRPHKVFTAGIFYILLFVCTCNLLALLFYQHLRPVDIMKCVYNLKSENKLPNIFSKQVSPKQIDQNTKIFFKIVQIKNRNVINRYLILHVLAKFFLRQTLLETLYTY